MPTSALRASMHQTLELLDACPSVDPEAYAASRHLLRRLMAQRAVEDDWIARLRACRSRLGRFGKQDLRKTLDADIQARRRQRRQLINRERYAERVVEAHERRYQALCDWHVDHLHQLVQGHWHARTLLDRQDDAIELAVSQPPGYLLAQLGAPPAAAHAGQVWRQAALAILRFRKDHRIDNPHHALGYPSVGAVQGLRRSEVQLLIDQARQLIDHPDQPLHLSEPQAPEVEPP